MNVEKTYQQLQKINSLNPEQLANNEPLHPIQKQYKKMLFSTLKSPDKMVEAICQYIRDNQLKRTEGFATSIFRMLQTQQLNKQGLEKIIKTFKNHYQLE